MNIIITLFGILFCVVFLGLGLTQAKLYDLEKRITHLEQVTFRSSRCPK